MKLAAVHDVIVALVAALDDAVDYPVFDGPLTKRPGRTQLGYVCIGRKILQR